MYNEFEISMIRQLKFPLGLLIKQIDGVIYIQQMKYVNDLL